MIHQLKILPKFFDAVVCGEKTFEIRKNDREFVKGDYLALNEWEQTSDLGGHYTGRSCMVYVDYILYGAEGCPGLDEDYVVMSIKPCTVLNQQNHMNIPTLAPSNYVITSKPVLNDRESENER